MDSFKSEFYTNISKNPSEKEIIEFDKFLNFRYSQGFELVSYTSIVGPDLGWGGRGATTTGILITYKVKCLE